MRRGRNEVPVAGRGGEFFLLLFALILVAVSQMGRLEAVLVGTVPVLFARLLRTAKRPSADQVLFNLGGHALSALAAYEVQAAAISPVPPGFSP